MRRGFLVVLAGAAAVVAACRSFSSDDPAHVASADAGGTSSSTSGGSGVPDAALDSGQACPEANLMLDEKNCGRCGRDCVGGSCNAGECTVVTLANAVTNAYGIALDANNVYVSTNTTGGAVVALGKDGSSFRTLASGLNAPSLFVVDKDVLYVGSNDGIIRVAIDGSGHGIVNTTQTTAVAIDSTHLYVCDFSTSGVLRFTKSNPNDPIEIQPTTNCESMVLDGQDLIFGGYNLGVASPAATATTATLVGGDARRLAVDSDSIYSVAYLDKIVYRTPRHSDAGMSAWRANDVNVNSGDIAVDATHVYWSLGSNPGKVLRAAKDNPAIVETIADNLGTPGNIALDDVAVYWTESTAGTIKKRAK